MTDRVVRLQSIAVSQPFDDYDDDDDDDDEEDTVSESSSWSSSSSSILLLSHPEQEGTEDEEAEGTNEGDEEARGDQEAGDSSAKRRYLMSDGDNKKQLLLMCVGLTGDDGKALFDLDEQPWKSLKKRDLKPSGMEYLQEVSRRANALNLIKIPKCKNWSAGNSLAWATSSD